MTYVETSILKNSTIMLLHSERSEIELSPEYQRQGGVWTLDKRRLLIDSILNDYDIPKIYFHILGPETSTKTKKVYAVIDGRQRLETIWDFIDNKFTLADEFEYQRDETISLAKLSYDDIAKRHPKIKVKFDSFVLPVITVRIEGDDIDLIEDMFSRLNEAVPLNSAEKRNAIGGLMVRSITEVANHRFFTECVRFRNNRFQHRESAARFMLIEESLKGNTHLIDTKKVYLDSLARKYREDEADNNNNSTDVQLMRSSVISVLDEMAAEFTQNDELLAAQGTLVVYYLIFKAATMGGATNLVTRRALLDFRQKVSANREAAGRDYENSVFELLEFDRLNQQGTNDASSIKERTRILGSYLQLDVLGILGLNKPTAPPT